jgi:hypothetical protein
VSTLPTFAPRRYRTPVNPAVSLFSRAAAHFAVQTELPGRIFPSISLPEWAEANSYRDAKLIPRQVMNVTYLVNVALLKVHSYPYAAHGAIAPGDTGASAQDSRRLRQ